MFGLPLCLPGSLHDLPNVEDQTLAHWFKHMMAGVTLQPPDMAWAYLREDHYKPALYQLYEGPYCVLQQMRNTALLQMGSKTEQVNLERLKPYVRLEAQVPATFLRRGCPPQKQPPGGRPIVVHLPPSATTSIVQHSIVLHSCI